MAPPIKKSRQQRLVFGAGVGLQASELASQVTSINSELSDLDSRHVNNIDSLAMETPQDSSSQASLVSTSRTIKKKRTCWVYKHMRGTDDMETIFKNQKGEKEWRCRYCMTDYQLSGDTSNIETLKTSKSLSIKPWHLQKPILKSAVDSTTRRP
jgi:hypothetical protein